MCRICFQLAKLYDLYFTESIFLSFVCKINDDYLKLRINHLMDVERALIADHIVPRDARDGGALEICCTL